jgi:hypothetical protein
MHLATISPGLTSREVFAAMSVRILPPVRNTARPTALIPLQRTGVTIRNRAIKKDSYTMSAQYEGRDRVDVSYAVIGSATRPTEVILQKMIDYKCVWEVSASIFIDMSTFKRIENVEQI